MARLTLARYAIAALSANGLTSDSGHQGRIAAPPWHHFRTYKLQSRQHEKPESRRRNTMPPRKKEPTEMTHTEYLTMIYRLGLKPCSKKTAIYLGVGVRQLYRFFNNEQSIPRPIQILLSLYDATLVRNPPDHFKYKRPKKPDPPPPPPPPVLTPSFDPLAVLYDPHAPRKRVLTPPTRKKRAKKEKGPDLRLLVNR
jgi:hypothetical protein